MENDWREGASRKYLAQALAAIALMQSGSAESAELTGEQVKAAVLSWSMQASIAYRNFSSGPRLSREFFRPITEELSTRLTFTTAILKAPRKALLRFEEEPAIHARATTSDCRNYEILINEGFVIALLLAALAVVNPDQGCASQFQITADRCQSRKFADVERTWLPLIECYRRSAVAHLIPDEPWRAILAHFILSRSLDYVVMHEVGHIVRGHLDFVASLQAEATIDETSKHKSSLPPAYARMLESQADDHASQFLGAKWIHLATTHNYQEGPLISGPGSFTFFNASDACLSMSISICLVFLLMDYGSITAIDHVGSNPSSDPSLANSYPPTDYRLWRALKLSNCQEISGVAWRDVLERVRGSLLQSGLIGASQLLPLNVSEQQLEEYDRRLGQEGSDVLLAEKSWAAKGLNTSPPPLPTVPKRFWIWNMGRQKR